MLENIESAIKNGQSRETGNIHRVHTTKGKSKMDNPEKLATYIGYTRQRQTTIDKLKQVA
jgi:hypothetical protein